MRDRAFTESTAEDAGLQWLEGVGWSVAHGPRLAPDGPAAKRADYGEVVLAQRLRDALARLNPELPVEALEDAFRKLTRPEGADLVQRNRALHRLLVDGVTVEYRDADGTIRGAQARVMDSDDPPSTCRAEVPALFATNTVLVASAGVEARAGTLTAGREWCKPWRAISGEALADARRTGCQEAGT